MAWYEEHGYLQHAAWIRARLDFIEGMVAEAGAACAPDQNAAGATAAKGSAGRQPLGRTKELRERRPSFEYTHEAKGGSGVGAAGRVRRPPAVEDASTRGQRGVLIPRCPLRRCQGKRGCLCPPGEGSRRHEPADGTK